MINRFLMASVFTLAFATISQVETQAAYTNSNGPVITNGTIIVTTRAGNEWSFLFAELL